MFAGSAFAAGPYITIYEDSNQNGDFVTDNGTDYAGLDNLTTAAGGWHDGGCHGAYWPITYTHWNNCISSWHLVLPIGTCFAAYLGASYSGTKAVYQYAASSSVNLTFNDLASYNDTYTSMRFGTWNFPASTCTW